MRWRAGCVSVVASRGADFAAIQVKNVNLWGCKLQDVSILGHMPNVEIVSLSVNSICSLREFGNCKKLKELYLRKNNVTDLTEVRFLTGLEGLRVLWLCDNPCVENSKYRKFVIHSLRGLTKLDNSDITEEERAAADQEDFADLIADAQEAASEQAAASPPGSPVPGAGAERPSSPLTATPKTERRGNILKAISFLLDDLDEQGLMEVQRQVQRRRTST